MAQSRRLELHPDRLFPSDPVVRDIARRLYQQIKDLPIVSPHGHTDPRWFAEDANWDNATALLLLPRVIFRATQVSPRRGLSWLNKIPLQAYMP